MIQQFIKFIHACYFDWILDKFKSDGCICIFFVKWQFNPVFIHQHVFSLQQLFIWVNFNGFKERFCFRGAEILRVDTKHEERLRLLPAKLFYLVVVFMHLPIWLKHLEEVITIRSKEVFHLEVCRCYQSSWVEFFVDLTFRFINIFRLLVFDCFIELFGASFVEDIFVNHLLCEFACPVKHGYKYNQIETPWSQIFILCVIVFAVTLTYWLRLIC